MNTRTRRLTRRHRMECLVRNRLRSRIIALYAPFEELIEEHQNDPGHPGTGMVDMGSEDFENAQEGVRLAVRAANWKLRRDSRLRPHEKRKNFAFSFHSDGTVFVLEN